jgi:hypothetical protein
MPAVTFALGDIPWDGTNVDGTRSATLWGTRDPGVMFTYAFFMPAGFWDGPHAHGAEIQLFVAAGELMLTLEEPWTAQTALIFSAGGFLHVPAGAVHADGARTDTIILGTTVGPWTTVSHPPPPAPRG